MVFEAIMAIVDHLTKGVDVHLQGLKTWNPAIICTIRGWGERKKLSNIRGDMRSWRIVAVTTSDCNRSRRGAGDKQNQGAVEKALKELGKRTIFQWFKMLAKISEKQNFNCCANISQDCHSKSNVFTIALSVLLAIDWYWRLFEIQNWCFRSQIAFDPNLRLNGSLSTFNCLYRLFYIISLPSRVKYVTNGLPKIVDECDWQTFK